MRKSKNGSSIEKSQEQNERDALVNTYMPLVTEIAGKIHRRLPPGIDIESLISSGVIGLLEANERYDPTRGASFGAFARHRIFGEIMEYLRDMDWVSRSVRRKGRMREAAQKNIEGEKQSAAEPEEIAEHMNITLDHYYKLKWQLATAKVVNMEDTEEADIPDFSTDPRLLIERKELVEKLFSSIQQLPPQEREILESYYFDDMTLDQIGTMVGLTGGRMCQLIQSAITQLHSLITTPQQFIPEKNGTQDAAVKKKEHATLESLEAAFMLLLSEKN